MADTVLFLDVDGTLLPFGPGPARSQLGAPSTRVAHTYPAPDGYRTDE